MSALVIGMVAIAAGATGASIGVVAGWLLNDKAGQGPDEKVGPLSGGPSLLYRAQDRIAELEDELAHRDAVFAAVEESGLWPSLELSDNDIGVPTLDGYEDPEDEDKEPLGPF